MVVFSKITDHFFIIQVFEFLSRNFNNAFYDLYIYSTKQLSIWKAESITYQIYQQTKMTRQHLIIN